MARSVSATYLTAQQAISATPYIKLLFTSKDTYTTVDLSTNSAAYGNRIIQIDHTEEPYNEFATIVLRNYPRTIPNIRGYWTEIGYGYVTGAGNEYLGDGTNEGAPPRLWVKHQQTVSAGGKLWEVLELEGMWSKLREMLIRLGDPPLYSKSYTIDTIYAILVSILAEGGMTLAALVEDDTIINSLQPQFSINAQPFEYAASIIYRLLSMTKSYMRPLDDSQFEIKYPQTSDAANLTFYSDQVPYFSDYIERANALIPNHFIVYGNEGSDKRWSAYIASASPYGIDQAEIDAYADVYKIVLAGSLTDQAQVDARAAALLIRAKAEQMAGRMVAPHDARLELYDKIRIEDSRGL